MVRDEDVEQPDEADQSDRAEQPDESDQADDSGAGDVHRAEPPPRLVFGLLVVAFVGSTVQALFMGGDRSVASWLRAALGIVGAVAVVVNWWFESRHPASIEVTAERIRWSRRGRTTVKDLESDEDPIHVFTVGRGRRPKALVRDGDGIEIPLDRFEVRAVLRSCRTHGWTIGPPVHGRAKLQSADLFP